MSLINVSLNLVAYADALKSANPSVKFTDLKWSMLGLPSNNAQMVPFSLGAGQSQTVMSLARTLSFNSSTSFTVVPSDGCTSAQLQGNFGARTGRSDGDGTTQWNMTVSQTLVQLQYTGTGTAPDFSTVMPGDGVTLGSAFGTFNQGDFIVTGKGSNYIQFINPIATNEEATGQVDIYSNGPVQIGDMLDITSPVFAFPNQGQYKISRVTDTFVEFSNPCAIGQTVTGVTTGLNIYPDAANWILMAIDNRVIVNFNGDTGTGVEVTPPVVGDLYQNPGLLLKRGKIFELTVFNPGLVNAAGFAFLAE